MLDKFIVNLKITLGKASKFDSNLLKIIQLGGSGGEAPRSFAKFSEKLSDFLYFSYLPIKKLAKIT